MKGRFGKLSLNHGGCFYEYTKSRKCHSCRYNAQANQINRLYRFYHKKSSSCLFQLVSDAHLKAEYEILPTVKVYFWCAIIRSEKSKQLIASGGVFRRLVKEKSSKSIKEIKRHNLLFLEKSPHNYKYRIKEKTYKKELLNQLHYLFLQQTIYCARGGSEMGRKGILRPRVAIEGSDLPPPLRKPMGGEPLPP